MSPRRTDSLAQPDKRTTHNGAFTRSIRPENSGHSARTALPSLLIFRHLRFEGGKHHRQVRFIPETFIVFNRKF